MLVDGVQYQADLRLQFVFGPHLTSLPAGFLSVEKELKRLLKQGFNGLHRLLPFAPGHFLPQGSAARKHEPGRYRRTTDGGCPRCPEKSLDGDGHPAVALNVAIGLKDVLSPGGSLKWRAQEVKPRLQDKIWDDLIFADAARLFHEPHNGFSTDIADYFNTIPLHPAEYWKSCLIWGPADYIDPADDGGGEGEAPFFLPPPLMGCGRGVWC